MTINPSGFETTFTLGELRRIRGDDLRPVPLPDEETDLPSDEPEESS